MGARLLRVLLVLLPGEFRDAYARELDATFRAEARDVRVGGRRGAGLALWAATAVDILRVAPGEHLDILRRDLRLALRAMAGRPAHTLTALVTLALGIGANVAMFAVIDAVLLAPLAYRDADRLVAVAEGRIDAESSTTGYLTFADVKARARSFSSLVAAAQSTATFGGDGQDPERVNAMRVSREYFEMAGVMPALGRAFTEAEDRPGPARQVAVLSDALWRRRFGADPRVVGRVVQLGDLPFTVVGVMPRGFDDLVAARMYQGAALWVPLGYDPAASFACRTCRHLRMFGRLAPGVAPEGAEAEVSSILGQLATEHPASYANPVARVTPLPEVFLGPVRPALLLLWGGVLLLLVVACANVVGLLLLGASARAGEIAVRVALGVTRARLARQLVTESGLLAATGAALGLLPAAAALRLVAVSGPAELPRLSTVALDARALAVAALLAVICAVVFGLAVLRLLWRREAGDELRGAGRRTGDTRVWRTRSLLVGANVAIAAILLASSGALVRSVSRLLAVDPGVRPEGVLTMKLWAGGARFRAGDTAQQIATTVTFYEDVLARARVLPGVAAAGAVSTLPLSDSLDALGFHVAGRASANPEEAPAADRFGVAGDAFAALGVPLLAGRLLDHRDTQAASRVVVINRAAADTLFRGEDPIGRQVMLGPPTAPPRTIVGVVGDVRHGGLDREAGPQVYVPQAQWAYPDAAMTLVIRAAGEPQALAGAVRDIVRGVDPAQPITDVRRYADVVAATTGTRRFVAGLLAAFAALALVLALVGLYGTLSVMVAHRRVELGIRLALGAPASAIRRLVLATGLRTVTVGLALGIAAALGLLRAMAGLLFEVRPTDPAHLAVAAGLLFSTAAAACAVPAWRASRIDAARSLRAE